MNGAQDLLRIVTRFPNISSLTLCSDLKAIDETSFNLLRHNTVIHTLKLNSSCISQAAHETLSQLIPSPFLQSLDIRNVSVEGRGHYLYQLMEGWGKAALQSQTLTDFKILNEKQLEFLNSRDEELDEENKDIRNRYKPLFEQVQAHITQNRHRQRQWQREAVVLSSIRANRTRPFKFSILPLVPQIMALASDNPHPLNKKRKKEESE